MYVETEAVVFGLMIGAAISMMFGLLMLIVDASRTATIVVTAMTGIIFGSSWIIGDITANASEADARQYAFVRARTKDCRLKPIIDAYAKDGMLDFGEFVRIRRLADGYDQTDQREELTGRRTVDCRTEAVRHARSVSDITPERIAPFLTTRR